MTQLDSELKEALVNWLGFDGLRFFQSLKDKNGSIDPCQVWIEKGIPHPLHLREGMQVRNFLRSNDLFKGLNEHWIENKWHWFIEQVI